jgi:hypothetical protein
MTLPAQTIRLSGVLEDTWVEHDNVDVIVHGVLRTKNAHGDPVLYEVTAAVHEDDAKDLATAIDQERDQLTAGPSAIDGYDLVVDERIAGGLEVA